MAGSLKTQGVVLRTIRYGEADKILHLYTPHRGRISAIAKGARKAKSRFGGRLEPFFCLELVLHEGKSDLLTVTGATTVAGFPRLRESGRAIDVAARSCDAVSRLFATDDPHPGVYALLCNQLALLDREPAAATPGNAIAFRMKLLLAAGVAPQLSACANCGEHEHLAGFSGAAGGVTCPSCEAGAFRLDETAHEFLVAALGRPLAQAPSAEGSCLAQADRAIRETAEHHAGVKLAPVSA
jgi:DNA repair protein RecO (recombination protein O)